MYRHNILKFNVFQPKHICYKQNKFPEFQVLKKKKNNPKKNPSNPESVCLHSGTSEQENILN